MSRRLPLCAAAGVGVVIGVLFARARGQDPAPSGAAAGAIATARAETLVLRLVPGQDLRLELQRLIEARGIEAAAVVTCVGSLTRVALRYADRAEATTLPGKFEVVSLVGTLSRHGSHLHLSVSDGEGRTLGGHLQEGCTVYTTAEVVLTVLPELRFRREPDPRSGFKELVVEPATPLAPR